MVVVKDDFDFFLDWLASVWGRKKVFACRIRLTVLAVALNTADVRRPPLCGANAIAVSTGRKAAQQQAGGSREAQDRDG